MDARSSFENKVLAAFAAAVLVVVLLAAATWKMSRDAYEATLRVSHTLDVLFNIAEAVGFTHLIELSTQGYRISGNAAQLAERDAAVLSREKSLRRIKELTADNAREQERFTRLRELVDERLAISRRVELLRKTEGLEAASTYAASAPLRETRERLLQVLHEMEDEERRLLEERGAEQSRQGAITAAASGLALLTLVALLSATYFIIRRQMRATEASRAALRESEENLSTTLHSIGDAVLATDTEGRVTRLNPVAEQLTGWPFAEAQGQPVDEVFRIINEQTRAPAVVPVAKVLATGELQGLANHSVLIARDGTGRPVADSAAPIRDAAGRVSGVVLVFRDVTAERRAEQEMRRLNESLEQASRAKSVFLATMSHEIRTPMNGVLGMIELLSLTKLDAEQRTTLEIVRESGKSLLRIIDDILDFSKIEAGKLEVRPEVASIKAVIEDVRNTYSGNASSKGLLIRQSLDPQISPAVLVDPLRLKQILNNFVSNAVKFTSQGSIEIKAELIERANGEDRLRFSVKDTGIGISAENRQRLFQPFSQGEGNTAQRFGGTGLGLAICRRLAGIMGGAIEMISELGKGTTMILNLSLPIADPKDLPKIDSQSTQDLLSTANIRRMAPSASQAETEDMLVLVVDDHPTNRALVARQVHALGYATESAQNGLEALDKWKSRRFGLVITDCNMPEMDGYALTRSIRKLESENRQRRTPIIACTANAMGGDAEICFAAGMDDYLVKPVALNELLKKLDQWLPIPKAAPTSGTAGKVSDSQAPGADAAVPIDRSVLAAIAGGDPVAERDILTDFRRVNDEDAAMLKRAAAQKDISQVTRASHRIKGASKTVGATGLAGVCERIEHASRGNDWPTVEVSMGAFHEEWMRLNAYLDSL